MKKSTFDVIAAITAIKTSANTTHAHCYDTPSYAALYIMLMYRISSSGPISPIKHVIGFVMTGSFM